MDEPRTSTVAPPKAIQSQGLMIGGHYVPPFDLGPGEALCLHIEHSSVPWYDGILKLLKGEVADPRLRIHGCIRYLQRPAPRRGWFGRRKDMPVQDWLLKERGLSPAEATRVLTDLSLAPDLRIGWMGWNERTLLALEALLVQPADVLVLDTAGNDPHGACRVFARLASRLPSLALIYLKTILDSYSPCFPGATCLTIAAAQPAKAASVE